MSEEKCGSEKDIYSMDQLEGIDGGKNHAGHRKDICLAWPFVSGTQIRIQKDNKL